MKPPYKVKLKRLFMTSFQVDEMHRMRKIEEEMKKMYPGNYTVEMKFDSSKGYWGPRLIFENEQEEVLFILKHS